MQPQLFVGQKSELMGEVLPREQDSSFKAMHEMVVTVSAMYVLVPIALNTGCCAIKTISSYHSVSRRTCM